MGKNKKYETDLFGNEKQKSVLDEIWEMQVEDKELGHKKKDKDDSYDIFKEKKKKAPKFSKDSFESEVADALGFNKEGKKKKKKDKDIFLNDTEENEEEDIKLPEKHAPVKKPSDQGYRLRPIKFVYNPVLKRFGVLDGISPITISISEKLNPEIVECSFKDVTERMSEYSTDMLIDIISRQHPTTVLTIDEFMSVIAENDTATMDPRFIFTKNDEFIFCYFVDIESLNSFAESFDLENYDDILKYLSCLASLRQTLRSDKIGFPYDKEYGRIVYENRDVRKMDAFFDLYAEACKEDPDEENDTPLVLDLDKAYSNRGIGVVKAEESEDEEPEVIEESPVEEVSDDEEEEHENIVIGADDDEEELEESEETDEDETEDEEDEESDDDSDMNSIFDDMIKEAAENDGDLDEESKRMIVAPR